MRIGLVCPYSWDVPGGVQSHVRDLARALRDRGHLASVLAPGEIPAPPGDHVETVGKAVPVPYNGSVARLSFGPRAAARARKWLRDGAFDIVHVHEPTTPSLSLLVLWACDEPVVATFHTALDRSRGLASVAALLRPSLEKLGARIAVSEVARETLVSQVGGTPVVIPNGIDHAAFAGAEPLTAWSEPGPVIGFLGRLDEPRKGFPLALAAWEAVAHDLPGARLLAAGPGDDGLGPLPQGVEALGRLDDADRCRFLRSVDVLIAPNTHGESFGIILVEAMAAGTPVVASDLPAFQAILADGCGRVFPVGDTAAAADALRALLADPAGRVALGARAQAEALRYDWSRVVGDVEGVYRAVLRAEALW